MNAVGDDDRSAPGDQIGYAAQCDDLTSGHTIVRAQILLLQERNHSRIDNKLLGIALGRSYLGTPLIFGVDELHDRMLAVAYQPCCRAHVRVSKPTTVDHKPNVLPFDQSFDDDLSGRDDVRFGKCARNLFRTAHASRDALPLAAV